MYRAVRPVRIAGRVIPPGEPVPALPGHRYAHLVASGRIVEAPDPAPDETGQAEEIARLSRELDAAQERERELRQALEGARSAGEDAPPPEDSTPEERTPEESTPETTPHVDGYASDAGPKPLPEPEPSIAGGPAADSAEGMSELTRAQLEELLAERGIDLAQVPGTGKDGYVTKADLVAALEKAPEGA